MVVAGVTAGSLHPPTRTTASTKQHFVKKSDDVVSCGHVKEATEVVQLGGRLEYHLEI